MSSLGGPTLKKNSIQAFIICLVNEYQDGTTIRRCLLYSEEVNDSPLNNGII